MPSWRKFVGGKTLTAKGLGKGKLVGKITNVSMEELRSPDGVISERLCLTIEDERKIVPLNVGNCQNLSKVYGEDFDDWNGKPVIVTVHKTHFGDKEVDGLLVMPHRDGKKK